MPPPPATDPYVGQTLPGGLVVRRLIGTGAFARVYEGRTPKNEPAAIKILQEKSPEAMQLFTREIKIMRALPPHRHRVRSMGDGHTQQHQPFLAMEFVDGGTLKDTIRQRGIMDINEAVDLMLQLCDAFSDLHALGVVHRDLKPENVLVSKTNQVKLSDFGLVKDAQGLLQLFEEEDILKGRVFHNRFDQRLVMGTPEYMAPEQFSDPLLDDQAQAKTDTWTDVYALGLVFYQMLAGHKLWQMKGSSASSVDAQRTLTEFIAVRVNPKSMEEVRCPPSVPQELWAIIDRSLRHDPKLRHHTALQMAEDIRTWMATGHAKDDFDDTATSAVSMKDFEARGLPAGLLPKPVSRSGKSGANLPAAAAPRSGPMPPAPAAGKSGAMPPMASGKSGASMPPPMSSGKSGVMPPSMASGKSGASMPPPMSSGKSGVMPPSMAAGKSGASMPPPMSSGRSAAVPAQQAAPNHSGGFEISTTGTFDDDSTRQVHPSELADLLPKPAAAADAFEDASTRAVDMKQVLNDVGERPGLRPKPAPNAPARPTRPSVVVAEEPVRQQPAMGFLDPNALDPVEPPPPPRVSRPSPTPQPQPVPVRRPTQELRPPAPRAQPADPDSALARPVHTPPGRPRSSSNAAPAPRPVATPVKQSGGLPVVPIAVVSLLLVLAAVAAVMFR